MAKVSPVQTAFNAGEFGPALAMRVDIDKYPNALSLCLNWLPRVEGGVTARPGTRHVAEIKDSTATTTRLIRFRFSTTQAYILEFGNLYFRIYRNHAQVESGGSPVEVVTPWASADLEALRYTQSADVLYVVHTAYAPRKVSRTSHIAWSVSTMALLDGPYLSVNSGDTTLTPSGGSYAVGDSPTITASAVTGINDGQGFLTTDVGRALRIKNGDDWAWGTITARASTTQVTVQVKGGTFPSTAQKSWRLGLYSDTTGYPSQVTFFQDRLCFAGCPAAPQRVDGSRIGDYENFEPTELVDGTVTDSSAISFTLNSTDVQVIRWMLGTGKGLLIGTAGAEWSVRASSLNEALTPTNVKADDSTARGSYDTAAVKVGSDSVIFVQASGRKLREMAYDFYAENFKTGNANKFASHITAGGIRELAWQQEPDAIVWARRADGLLLGLTFDKDEGVMGWHRHKLGGTSDSGGTHAKVESIAVIPEPDGTYDELWMIVKRYVNGSTKRYVEYLTKVFDSGDSRQGGTGDAQEDACLLDGSSTYDSTATTTITGLTHLAGATVGILADGAVHPDKTVSAGGVLTLDRAASVVQVGYSYNSDGVTLRNNAGAADGTAQGKIQRFNSVTFRLMDTGSLSVGRSFALLDDVTFRTSADDLGVKVPLFTGDKFVPWDGDHTTENLICFRRSQPLPATVLGIMPQQTTNDHAVPR